MAGLSQSLPASTVAPVEPPKHTIAPVHVVVVISVGRRLPTRTHPCASGQTVDSSAVSGTMRPTLTPRGRGPTPEQIDALAQSVAFLSSGGTPAKPSPTGTEGCSLSLSHPENLYPSGHPCWSDPQYSWAPCISLSDFEYWGPAFVPDSELLSSSDSALASRPPSEAALLKVVAKV